MVDQHIPNGQTAPTDETLPPEYVAGGAQWNPVTAAALVGGAIAATASAYFGTRALARRHRDETHKPPNSVMANAITACDLAHPESGEKEPAVPAEPSTATEPSV